VTLFAFLEQSTVSVWSLRERCESVRLSLYRPSRVTLWPHDVRRRNGVAVQSPRQDTLPLNLSKPTGHVMHQSLTFNNCMLCPHCIFVFCIYLRTNSDLCHLQHKLIGFYNRDESVYCAIRIVVLNKAVCASSFKGSTLVYPLLWWRVRFSLYSHYALFDPFCYCTLSFISVYNQLDVQNFISQ